MVTLAGFEPATSPAPVNKDALSPLSYSVIVIFMTFMAAQGRTPERRFPLPWSMQSFTKLSPPMLLTHFVSDAR
jgi:hypothetical protein